MPSVDLQTRGAFALPLDPIDQGPCPMDPRERRSALTSLTNRPPVGYAPGCRPWPRPGAEKHPRDHANA
ncbi:MAG TPA: hypothetical protein VFA67_02425 [Candidatus Sulfotelmatobacter sp.]|nr:hypothetical protein [Candidatus Sulfotelmatobacter sp.]